MDLVWISHWAWLTLWIYEAWVVRSTIPWRWHWRTSHPEAAGWSNWIMMFMDYGSGHSLLYLLVLNFLDVLIHLFSLLSRAAAANDDRNDAANNNDACDDSTDGTSTYLRFCKCVSKVHFEINRGVLVVAVLSVVEVVAVAVVVNFAVEN